MIKTYCNRCKQLIRDKDFSCLIIMKDSSPSASLMFKKLPKGMKIERQEQHHLCRSCWNEIRKQLNENF